MCPKFILKIYGNILHVTVIKIIEFSSELSLVSTNEFYLTMHFCYIGNLINFLIDKEQIFIEKKLN